MGTSMGWRHFWGCFLCHRPHGEDVPVCSLLLFVLLLCPTYDLYGEANYRKKHGYQATLVTLPVGSRLIMNQQAKPRTNKILGGASSHLVPRSRKPMFEVLLFLNTPGQYPD
eukprot:5297863-Amphidinium_carterae.1